MKSEDLKKLGLTKKEAKVYLACLELGHASGQEAAKKAGIPKSTAYDTLKALTKKGVVSVYVKRGRKRFTPADPYIIKEKIERQEKLVDKMLPELEALYSSTAYPKPRVRFFEGKSGFEVVKNEIFKEAEEVVGIVEVEQLFKKLSNYFPEFPKERTKRKIPIKLIMQDSPLARERKATGTEELREVKIVDTEPMFKAVILVWKNKVAAITLGKDVMILIIESQDLAQTFLGMHRLLWGYIG